MFLDFRLYKRSLIKKINVVKIKIRNEINL